MNVGANKSGLNWQINLGLAADRPRPSLVPLSGDWRVAALLGDLGIARRPATAAGIQHLLVFC